MAIQPIKDTRNLVFVTSPQAIQPEFSPAFYSTATFRITEPEHGLAFIRDLRPDNLPLVRKLSIFVEAFYTKASPSMSSSGSEKTPPLPFWIPKPNAPTWYALLEALRDQLPGLREVEIYLHAELTGYHQDIPRMGAGEDPEFVGRLAALKGLEKLELDGFFAREWPAYLERELGLGADGETGKGKRQSVWAAKGRTETYLTLLGRYQGYCAPLEL